MELAEEGFNISLLFTHFPKQIKDATSQPGFQALFRILTPALQTLIDLRPIPCKGGCLIRSRRKKSTDG